MYTKNPDRTNWGIRNLILIWVVLALGVVCWTNPNFWMDSVDYFKKAQKAADRGDYENAMIQIETAILHLVRDELFKQKRLLCQCLCFITEFHH